MTISEHDKQYTDTFDAEQVDGRFVCSAQVDHRLMQEAVEFVKKNGGMA